MKNLEILGISVDPGQKKTINLPVATMPRGDVLSIPVTVYRGAKLGPSLGIVCTSHGDETFPIIVMEQVLNALDLQELHGAVVAIPVLNPLAFETGIRLTGLEMTTEAVNMNLVFPGNPQGSLIARMAYQVSTNFLSCIDFLVDYHGGAVEKAIDYMLVDCSNEAVLEQSKDLAIAYGAPITVISDGSKSRKLDSSITAVANRMGIPSIIPMCGGQTLVTNREFFDRQVNSLKNVLKKLGMVNGELEEPKERYLYKYRLLIRHTQGGLFLPSIQPKDLGKVFSRDYLLGKTISPYTFEVLEEFKAPYDQTAIISLKALFMRVSPGEYAYIVADASTRKPI
jgi:hypothetical protein